MKKKFNIFIIFFTLAIVLPIIMILVISFRNYSIESATQKAKIIANIVRDGLTTHMEYGLMDKRDTFLSKIKNVEGVENIRILRSPTVDKQFGRSFESEHKLTPIEKEVLTKGIELEEVVETPKKVQLKVVIPYIASAYSRPNCLKCHQAKEGEVLGAISMDFDITPIREYSVVLILKIVLIIIILSVIAIYVLNRYLDSYVKFFEDIKKAIKAAYEGDYSKRLGSYKDKELKEVAKWFNTLLEKIENSLKKIAKNVHYFIDFTSQTKDPLESMRELVEELAAIYKFKSIIEKDSDIKQVYTRIGELFIKKFSLDNFAIFEYIISQKKRKILFSHNYHPICKMADENIELCRAYKIKEPINSDRFLQICPAVEKENAFYICIPIEVSEDVVFVVTIVAEDEERYKNIRSLVNHLLNYLKISKSTLQTKELMEELRHQTLIDKMTGVYNRRYLDIFVEKNIPQAIRTNTPYSIMMLDIDHFKMVNDTYGHDAGDKVIKSLVDVIKSRIRESDVIVRFGGEEFLVLLYNCPKEEAKKIAEQIRESLKSLKIELGKDKISKTVSIGISEFPKDTSKFWQAIKFADMALYKAKESGRDRVVVYNPNEFEEKKEY